MGDSLGNPLERGKKMKKVFKVEIKKAGAKVNGTHYFETNEQATDFAIVATAFSGGLYNIQEIFVNEEVWA